VAAESEFVLLLAGDFVKCCDVFRGHSHVVAVENFIETVIDHHVGNLGKRHAHPVAPTGLRHDKRRIAHDFHAAGNNNVGIAGRNRLSGQCNGFHARSADLVNRIGIGFFRKTRINTGLPGDILSLSALQNIAHNDFIHVNRLKGLIKVVIFFIDVRHLEIAEGIGTAAFMKIINGRSQPGAFHGFLHHQCPDINRLDTFQRSAEFSHSGSGAAHNYYIFHA